MSEKKKQTQFNIISNQSTTHGAYHTGTISLNNLSAILIDDEQVKIDLGLIHGKSAVERGIKFTSKQEEVIDGKSYWVVWIAVDRKEEGAYYAGATACFMKIDRDSRKGYKNLAEHVNRLDDALKRRVKLANLSETDKGRLKKFLQEYNEEMWQLANEKIKEQLG
ncbi:YwhD family protein [Hazenella sp. IB182357]|uniref:YwhD family protein n=1 Tax=Polycladospora coralii TaxID=2771432 RepID=A0A926RU67_9BACL|nr:YwhD family protein [Polycladospora coralii]MBD1372014.1 YwhD family protein [Polycladospora coralii]MBS7530520.1 YwhD family protein [Polycladospora coralii]